MQREDFWFRFRRSFHELFYGERALTRATSRLVLLTLIAGALYTVGPSIADVLTQDDPGPNSTYIEPEPTPEASETAEPMAEPDSVSSDATTPPEPDSEPTPDYSVEPASEQPPSDDATEPDEEASPSPTPTEEPDSALSPQPRYVLKVPQSMAIDPRANTYFLPSIYMAGSEFSLVCIRGQGINFDLSDKRISNDNYDTSTVMVSGDGGSRLLVAGNTQAVRATINSNGGLFAYTNTGGLRDKSASVTVIATNRATLDPEFCGAADPANMAFFSFRAIGLQLDTRKGTGKLK